MKQVEELNVKIADEWKNVIVARIKEGDEWKVSHVKYQRHDITISSNTTNYVLRTELNNLGASPGTLPQHVNITIEPGVFLFGTSTTSPALDLSTLNVLRSIFRHKVRILIKDGGGIIGSSGAKGTTTPATRTGSSGGNGGNAIKTGNGVDLFIENYGTISGGGGGGGAGGFPVNGSTESLAGGNGGHGAGYNTTLGYITENSSNRNGTDSAVNYGIHGGDGGLLGQLGIGAGGFNDSPAAGTNDISEPNPGTNYTQYGQSGDGGIPGSAIIGYDAARITFINTGSVYGDSAYKFKA